MRCFPILRSRFRLALIGTKVNMGCLLHRDDPQDRS